MSQVAAHPFSGTFRAEPVSSTFALPPCATPDVFPGSAARWPEVAGDASRRRRCPDAGGVGARGPRSPWSSRRRWRASLLGPEFFDAEHHPEITFRSTEIRLADDGRAEVDGELTMKGIIRPVTRRRPVLRTPTGRLRRGSRLPAHHDHRPPATFGFAWQAELPEGGLSVGWDVQLDIDLLLMRATTRPAKAEHRPRPAPSELCSQRRVSPVGTTRPRRRPRHRRECRLERHDVRDLEVMVPGRERSVVQDERVALGIRRDQRRDPVGGHLHIQRGVEAEGDRPPGSVEQRRLPRDELVPRRGAPATWSAIRPGMPEKSPGRR